MPKEKHFRISHLIAQIRLDANDRDCLAMTVDGIIHVFGPKNVGI